MAVKLRLGVLTTPARGAQGRDLPGLCDLGCGCAGTLHHILLVCPRVQPWRISRHDRILDLLVSQLGSKGLSVLREPGINTPQGLRKPDLIIWSADRSWVVDVQIVADAAVCTLMSAQHKKG